MTIQDQFLDVIDRDEAKTRFRAALDLEPLGSERVMMIEALGRILAADVVASVDVPSFDRSNFDGFAVRSSDTFGAAEMSPRALRLLSQSLDAGPEPTVEVGPGEAVLISTGGMVPRGADAILMIEHAEVQEDQACVLLLAWLTGVCSINQV